VRRSATVNRWRATYRRRIPGDLERLTEEDAAVDRNSLSAAAAELTAARVMNGACSQDHACITAVTNSRRFLSQGVAALLDIGSLERSEGADGGCLELSVVAQS